ncbi:MAG: hypothetical protein GC172_12085 [Phycisphaera sp.]|nr:hypothetical protein [Phycisphaera sp.]
MPSSAKPSAPLDIRNPALVEAILDSDAMAIWECLRRLDRASSARQIAEASTRPIGEVDRALEALLAAKLVRRLRVRGRRSSIGYKVHAPTIVVGFDRRDAEQRAIVERISAHIDQHLEGQLFRDSLPLDQLTAADWHFRLCNPITLDRDDLVELQRRVELVEQFLSTLRERRGADGALPTSRCNHAISIRVAPLGGHVLPQPTIEVTTQTARDVRRYAEREVRAPLSARERSVAIELRGGASRAEVAKRLGLSVYTVGTLCKRIFRKLGIRRVTELNHSTI